MEFPKGYRKSALNQPLQRFQTSRFQKTYRINVCSAQVFYEICPPFFRAINCTLLAQNMQNKNIENKQPKDVLEKVIKESEVK